VNHFSSLRNYENFIYTIQLLYPSIISSTLVIVPRGAGVVLMRGELFFRKCTQLAAWERITIEYGVLQIETYGYEV
jgi:hypothetical protein